MMFSSSAAAAGQPPLRQHGSSAAARGAGGGRLPTTLGGRPGSVVAAAGGSNGNGARSSSSSSNGGGQRRAFGSRGSAGRPPAPSVEQLKHVQGIGRSYERLLRGRGIETVEQLSDGILRQLGGGGGLVASTSSSSGGGSAGLLAAAAAPAVQYLQGLGIRRQDHAQRIVAHITAVYAPELHSQLFAEVLAQQQQQAQQQQGQDATSAAASAAAIAAGSPSITFCVEGNISAGKSTFLGYITADNPDLQAQLGVVHEPVDQWQAVPTVGGGTLNLLDRFYADPPRYAYPFQTFVFMSRVLQERDSQRLPRPVRLMERSVFSDRMVFVRAVRESGWMGDVELAVYDSWFDPILKTSPTLVPDGFIYLRCDPATCMERLKLRGRAEETTISLDYLEGLHAKHEDWLGSGTNLAAMASSGGGGRGRSGNGRIGNGHGGGNGAMAMTGAGGGYGYAPAASGSGLLLPPSVPDRLADSLFLLNKHGSNAPPDMHALLHNVPALVLDCNADVLNSAALRAEVQDTVAAYVGYMRELKALRAAAAAAVSSSSSSGSSRAGVESVLRVAGGAGAQPGAPEGAARQHVELVASSLQQVDARAVAKSSGSLAHVVGNDAAAAAAVSAGAAVVDAAGGAGAAATAVVLDSVSAVTAGNGGGDRAVTGALEALQFAATASSRSSDVAVV